MGDHLVLPVGFRSQPHLFMVVNVGRHFLTETASKAPLWMGGRTDEVIPFKQQVIALQVTA